MAASKVMEVFDSKQFKRFNSNESPLPRRIPPIGETVPRKPKKIDMSQSLVAPLEKTDVPNHLLNTSPILFLKL